MQFMMKYNCISSFLFFFGSCRHLCTEDLAMFACVRSYCRMQRMPVPLKLSSFMTITVMDVVTCTILTCLCFRSAPSLISSTLACGMQLDSTSQYQLANQVSNAWLHPFQGYDRGPRNYKNGLHNSDHMH